MNKTTSWFFVKINKIDKPLANLTKKRREKSQISKIRIEKSRKHQTPRKSKESSDTTLRTYIQVNWKIIKKWINL
jgi:hypothetical protein